MIPVRSYSCWRRRWGGIEILVERVVFVRVAGSKVMRFRWIRRVLGGLVRSVDWVMVAF